MDINIVKGKSGDIEDCYEALMNSWDKGTGTLSLLNLKISILHLNSNPTPSDNITELYEGM